LTQFTVLRRQPVGEIVAVALHPDRLGQGLGRELVIGGLAALADRGAQTCRLYVDANNARAVRLYVSLGFQVFRVDRRYGLRAPPVL
jgi:mycothiol synthase